MSFPEILELKKQLTITPKTASLLINAGYANYKDLANVSPEHVAKQFAAISRMPTKQAMAYKRPLRRIVWLGTQDSPETYPKDCKKWSDRALRARGAWCNNFDQLTGQEIDSKLKDACCEKAAKQNKKRKPTD